MAIFNGPPKGRNPSEEPMQKEMYRVFGTPSSNRAELYAVLQALRICRPVREVHLQCDSEVALKMVTKALQGKKIKQSTPNRDLIMKCTEEIQWRDTQESYTTSWHDVKAHTEEEPPEHKKADILADKAAKLPLPPNNEHLRRLQPMWSLMYKGIPRQDDGLKTIMKTLEETGAKADAKVARWRLI